MKHHTITGGGGVQLRIPSHSPRLDRRQREAGLRAEGPLELILEDELEDLFRRRSAVECGIRGQ